jgi:hypothetical protein
MGRPGASRLDHWNTDVDIVMAGMWNGSDLMG